MSGGGGKGYLVGAIQCDLGFARIAFAQRSQSQMIARFLDTNLESQGFLFDLGEQLQALSADILAIADSDDLDQGVRSMLHHIDIAQQRLAEITHRSIASLETNHYFTEKDMPLLVLVCSTCGCFVENTRPETCPICGALSAQFKWFGPYYSRTL